jgi:hypothetical protein
LLVAEKPRFFEYARRYEGVGGAQAVLVQSSVKALSR